MLRGPTTIKKLLGRGGKRVGVWLLFEPRDLWIGVYWTVDCTHGHIYVTLIPTLPVLFTWVRGRIA